MKLARKFVAAITLVVIGVLGVSHLFSVSREEAFYDAHVVDYHLALGRAVAALSDCVGDARSVETTSRCLDALDVGVDGRMPRLRVREVSADAPPTAQTDPSAEGYTTRIPSADGRSVLEVSETSSRHDELRRGLWLEWSLTALALVTIATIVMFALGATLIGRPMERLVLQARRVGAGDYSPAQPPRQRDEIGVLSEEMNQMCVRIRASDERARDEADRRSVAIEQLRRADRLGTAGQLAAGVAHELGTPLNIAQGRAQLIAEDAAATPAITKNARTIVEQVVRMSGIIRQLLGFTRRGRAEVAECDLRLIARTAVDLLRSMAKKEAVTLDVELPSEAVLVRADAGLLGQVAVNLVVNAVQARRAGAGHVRVVVARRAAPDDTGELRVVDDGTGIAPEDLPHLFEPFFTTKEVGRGTGLGLWVSYGIVKEYGGVIEVESVPGEGASFSVVLPLSSRPTLDAPEAR